MVCQGLTLNLNREGTIVHKRHFHVCAENARAHAFRPQPLTQVFHNTQIQWFGMFRTRYA